MSSLCKACLPIFQDHHELPPDIENPFKFGYGKFKLHGTATGLLESAGSGCVLCLRICNLARREWWLQLAEDQKLKLPLIKAAYFSLEWALQPFENGLKIQFKLTAALAHSISPLYRNFSLLVVRKDGMNPLRPTVVVVRSLLSTLRRPISIMASRSGIEYGLQESLGGSKVLARTLRSWPLCLWQRP